MTIEFLDCRGFPGFKGHEEVVRVELKNRGKLHGYVIIAIHNPILGPPFGGTRNIEHNSTVDAVTDCLRLSEGMTYKAALAGTGTGGGKAVFNPCHPKWNDDILHAYGYSLEEYADNRISRGKEPFWTGEDMRFGQKDALTAFATTRYMAGLPVGKHSNKFGTRVGGGDPSPYTALGAFQAILALLSFGSSDQYPIEGKSFGIQGVGKVGLSLALRLSKAGGRLIIADTDQTALECARDSIKDVQIVHPAVILQQKVDVLIPAAGGAVLNADSIPKLRCGAIAPVANNVLAEEHHAHQIHELRYEGRRVTLLPDFMVNAGGLIEVTDEALHGGFDETRVKTNIDKIGPRIHNLLELSRFRKSVPFVEAMNMAHMVLDDSHKYKGLHRYA